MSLHLGEMLTSSGADFCNWFQYLWYFSASGVKSSPFFVIYGTKDIFFFYFLFCRNYMGKIPSARTNTKFRLELALTVTKPCCTKTFHSLRFLKRCLVLAAFRGVKIWIKTFDIYKIFIFYFHVVHWKS